jgi:hypothetical protein
VAMVSKLLRLWQTYKSYHTNNGYLIMNFVETTEYSG